MQFAQYAWLIPLFPLLAFALIILTPLKHYKVFSSGTAILMIAASWVLSWLIFFVDQEYLIHEMEAGHPYSPSIGWLPTGTTVFEMSLLLDGLALAMLFMVPFVVTMIFIYSTGYHNLGTPNVEPRYSRFFAYVSLFAAGMLTLSLSGNMLLFFIAWEIMGLCSYLLIGFWFEKGDEFGRLSPRLSALKAFLTTRVGDVLFFAGLMLLYAQVGTLNIHDALTVENIEAMKHATFGIAGLFTLPVLPTIALLIFGGAVGKSAQFPLHVWLPDAMAGPTPVSAMIHAATMVAAGVFLVARMLPLFEPLHGSPQLMVVALIGAFTAFFAGTIALAQNDVKGVLAYSTISQLGYMIAALGLGGLVAGVFHMLTHAFFKALLFMSSGSVIHGMEHGVHHLHGHGEHHPEAAHAASHAHEHGHAPGEDMAHAEHGVADDPAQHAHADDHHGHIDPQNMWNMGGLNKHMRMTSIAFHIGGAALAGVPLFTAGFWSKDEILAQAAYLYGHPDHYESYLGLNVPLIVLILLSVSAVLTAFYTGRQLGLTFWGSERTEEAKHAHESPLSMIVPLGILSLFAIGIGWINIPEGAPLFPANHALGHILEHVHDGAIGQAYEAHDFNPGLAGLVSIAGLAALVGGAWFYAGRATEPLRALGPLWTAMERKWYVDEIYNGLVIRPAVAFSQLLYKVDGSWLIDPIVNNVGKFGRGWGEVSSWMDRNLVDGTVNLISVLANETSEGLKRLQTGRVQNYLVILLGGLLFLAGLFFR